MAEPKPPPDDEKEPKTRGKGRPTKLTPAIQASILQTLRLCGTQEDAAATAGVGRSTLLMWKNKGLRQERGKYRDFVDALLKAENERRTARELQIISASRDRVDEQGNLLRSGDWRAMAWIMERTEPRKYAPRVYQHVDKELEDALDRLEREFGDEPQILERAFNAIAGGQGRSSGGGEEVGEHGADDRGGEAVHPAPAKPEATPGPRA